MNRATHILKLMSLLLLASLATTVNAQSESAFQVEAILFSQPSSPMTGGRTPDYAWADDAVMLEETARSDVRKLDDTQRRLEREADKLKAQGYQVLMHSTWAQPADSSLKVAVHQGETLGDHYPVEAVVGLSRAQDSLEIEVKAWRHSLAGGQNAESSELVSEQMHQTRRLRLDEIHYLDHQSMGMLVRVTRR